jgi:hypothetical protein
MLRLLPGPHPVRAFTKLGPVGHGPSLQASCDLTQGLEPPFPACFLGTLVLEIGIRDWFIVSVLGLTQVDRRGQMSCATLSNLVTAGKADGQTGARFSEDTGY